MTLSILASKLEVNSSNPSLILLNIEEILQEKDGGAVGGLVFFLYGYPTLTFIFDTDVGVDVVVVVVLVLEMFDWVSV